MTLLSRVLGLVRDQLLAIVFGASAAMDAFLVAQKIPNFMRRLFAEGAFAQAFVPVLAATRAKDGKAAVRELVSVVSGTLGVVLICITIVGVVGAPLVIALFAWGFLDNAEQYDQAVAMLRLTFPYLMLISLVALAAGVLNTHERFAVPAFAPVLLNVCMITAAVVFAPNVKALAAAVLIAGILQLLLHLPSLAGLDMLVKPRVDFQHSQVRRVLRMMLPIMFGASIAQINLLLDTMLATLLIEGSVSWLYFSDRLMEFPLGLFSIALATVMLPRMSARHAANDTFGFSATIDWALRWMAVLGIPAGVGLFVLAGPLVATLFGYREFAERDVSMASASLMAYSLGFIGFSLIKMLTPGFFAREDARTPVRIGVIALTCTMLLNLLLVGGLTYGGFFAVHAGLALGTSLGAFINAGLLFRALRRERVYQPFAGWAALGLRVFVALAAMVGVLVWQAEPLQWWLDAEFWVRIGRLVSLIMLAVGSYFATLGLLGLRPRHLRLATKAAGPVTS